MGRTLVIVGDGICAASLTVLVFVVGMGSLGAEIAAVRLLAPVLRRLDRHLGQHDRRRAGRAVGRLLARRPLGRPQSDDAGAVPRRARWRPSLLALVPFVGRPLLDVAVEALDDVSAGAFLGSLLAVLVPGGGARCCCSARCRRGRCGSRCSDVENAGTIAGRLYALSTAGSLVGTLLSALVLIPLVGTRRTFLIFALLIAVVAVTGPAAGAPLRAGAGGDRRADRAAGRHAQGQRRGQGDPRGRHRVPVRARDRARRRLARARAERGAGQPLALPRPTPCSRATTGTTTSCSPFATGRTTPPRRVAILGNAGGTTARAYGELFPSTRVDAVEIDPRAVRDRARATSA